MSFDPDDFPDIHEECVPADEVVQYALQNHGEEIDQAVNEKHAEEWLSRSRACLELLSIVSQRDREHMRSAIKKRLRNKKEETEEPTDDQLFAIAADVSAYLEQLAKTFNVTALP